MIGPVREYWATRTPTKRGWWLPQRPPGAARYGQASSARRRYEDTVSDHVRARQCAQLAPGVLVVWDRRPWRILEIREKPLDLWDEKYEEEFARQVRAGKEHNKFAAVPVEIPERATWRDRPINVQLIPVDGDGPVLHLRCAASHCWDVLPEHYAVCVACGELPPCRHELAERQADEEAVRAEVRLSIPPGHCLGCGEAITSRMQAVRFPGPNLWRPDLPEGSAVFHARKECAGQARQYRYQWEAKGGETAIEQLAITEEGGSEDAT